MVLHQATIVSSILATYPPSINLTSLIAMVQALLRFKLRPQNLLLLIAPTVASGTAHAIFRVALVIGGRGGAT